MTALVVRNGRVVHPDAVLIEDVVIVDEQIVAVGKDLDAPAGALEIDATDCWVGPSFVDLHAHLREPGFEHAETILSAANAAAVGGYGAVVAMPNTEPALDSVAVVAYVLDRGANSLIDVAVAGAITIARAGERLAPMAELAALGVRLFSDDGTGVQDAALMRRALEYARPLGVRLAQHCEDAWLAAGGSMNEGSVSSRLGLTGRPALAEELMVLRDLKLARATRGRLHLLHLSTARSLSLVAQARAEGVDVTFEVAPHHFTLDESACATYDPVMKVHPPLRTKADVEALRTLLRDGELDAVATDHAPHVPESKDRAFDEAPAGMLGLEHAASLTYEALGGVDADPRRFFALLSRGPARVAQLRAHDVRPRHGAHGGDVVAGEMANVVIFDPMKTYVVDRDALQSRSTNTPYHGRTLHGQSRATIVKGCVVAGEGVLA
ncbi:MAG: dihydroorotase [Acidobacteriota bacterium]|nr:dihydroorotase [Acidobacteriota bacterium]